MDFVWRSGALGGEDSGDLKAVEEEVEEDLTTLIELVAEGEEDLDLFAHLASS